VARSYRSDGHLEPLWRWAIRVTCLTVTLVFLTALTLLALLSVTNGRHQLRAAIEHTAASFTSTTAA